MKYLFMLILSITIISLGTTQVCVSLDNWTELNDDGNGMCTYDITLTVDSGNGANGTATFSLDGIVVYEEANCTCNPSTITFPVTVECGSTIDIEVFYNAPGNGNDCSGMTGGVTLPVNWLDIKGVNKESTNLIRWDVIEEVDLDQYIVERAGKDYIFQSIGSVDKKEGLNNSINSYTFLDRSPIAGYNYYRIKQVDLNQDYTYSDIISLYNSQEELSIAFPNPFNDVIRLKNESEWTLFDSYGRQVLNGKGEIINTENLSNGVYYLMFQNGQISGKQILIKS